MTLSDLERPNVCHYVLLMKKLNNLQYLIRTTAAKSQIKTANITKDDITSQHIAEMSLYCELISSFVIFAVKYCH